ncbi:DUF5819 family protein [Streptomyces sp. NPDC046821]|uniref:DUF5819 family protein n=1 Tax=Streptomyces sp. NPDC046821 TaxID=3154702 RepID=UPI0033DA8552
MDAYDKGSTARRSDPEPSPGPSPEPSDGPGAEPSDGPGAEPSDAPGAEPWQERSPAPSRGPELGRVTPVSPEAHPEAQASEPALAQPVEALTPRTGLSALSLRYQILGAFALVLIAVGACTHLAMVFLHVAPPNTVSKKYGRAVDGWVYPEFEQNWKLFAPNPLQQNIAVQARAEIRTADGGTRTTGWYDLSAQDGAAIDGNLLPSHTQQNELRRAWDFYMSSHDGENRPNGLRGQLSERYIRRIVVLRLSAESGLTGGDSTKPGSITRVQVRSQTTNVEPPSWSGEKVDLKPYYRENPWWTVTVADRALDDGTRARAAAGTAGAR